MCKSFPHNILLTTLLLIIAVGSPQNGLADDKPAADDKATAVASPDDSSDDDAEDSDESPSDKAKTDSSKASKAKASTTKAKKKPKAKKRDTHTVEIALFEHTVELKGTFAARNRTEIALRPDSWSSFKIDEIVEHGTEVREGDVLIRFDSQKINRAIESLALDLHLSELAIRKAEDEIPRLEKTLELNLAEATRQARLAKEDYDRFKTLEQGFYEKMVAMSVKGQEYNLSYLAEELNQLQKMYEADDLTEETEEIILTRSRNDLELAEFNVEDAKFYRESALKVTIPRMESRLQNQVDAANLALERAKTAQQINLNQNRYELEKKRQQRALAVEKHAKLLGDRALMEIKSPTSGIVYFGRCVRGKWNSFASLISKQRRFGSVQANAVLMTIVEPRPLYVEAVVGEADLADLEIDQPAEVTLPHESSETLAANIEAISRVPISTGKFGVELKTDTDTSPDWLVPGVSCKIEITTYEKENAIAVPEDAVHTADDDSSFVWVVKSKDPGATPLRRSVTTGKKADEQVEILTGLAAGEIVSLEDEKEAEEKASSDEKSDGDTEDIATNEDNAASEKDGND